MPLTKPAKKQTLKEFLDSCMSSPVMNKEFPDSKRRAAVCYSQFERRAKTKGSASWDECLQNGILTLF
jgi:hypothetical protein